MVDSGNKGTLGDARRTQQIPTLTMSYSSICGYTQKELETVFADYLEGVDLNEVRKWYDGYNWLGKKVYNPFDIFLYLRNKEFRSYWFETATI